MIQGDLRDRAERRYKSLRIEYHFLLYWQRWHIKWNEISIIGRTFLNGRGNCQVTNKRYSRFFRFVAPSSDVWCWWSSNEYPRIDHISDNIAMWVKDRPYSTKPVCTLFFKSQFRFEFARSSASPQQSQSNTICATMSFIVLSRSRSWSYALKPSKPDFSTFWNCNVFVRFSPSKVR